jgi:ATP-dependent Clp protease adapter protein ClpS
MAFQDKYISTTDKKAQPTSEKVVLTDDAYAISEFIDNLITKIEEVRRGLL